MTSPSMFEQKVLPLFEESPGDWLTHARAVAVALAERLGTVTVDDVRDHLPPRKNADPRIMGAVLTRKHWECIGYEQSRRKTCHKRPIGRFKLRVEGRP